MSEHEIWIYTVPKRHGEFNLLANRMVLLSLVRARNVYLLICHIQERN